MEVEGCFLRLFTEILFGPLFRYRMRTKTFKNSIEDRFVSQTLKLHRSNHRSSISIKSSKLHLDQIIEAPLDQIIEAPSRSNHRTPSRSNHRSSTRSNHRSSTDQIFSPPPNDDPPNALRNRIRLRNLALVHVALITSLMQRVAGSTVTNDCQHGACGGMYGTHEHYVHPYPVTNP